MEELCFQCPGIPRAKKCKPMGNVGGPLPVVNVCTSMEIGLLTLALERHGRKHHATECGITKFQYYTYRTVSGTDIIVYAELLSSWMVKPLEHCGNLPNERTCGAHFSIRHHGQQAVKLIEGRGNKLDRPSDTQGAW